MERYQTKFDSCSSSAAFAEGVLTQYLYKYITMFCFHLINLRKIRKKYQKIRQILVLLQHWNTKECDNTKTENNLIKLLVVLISTYILLELCLNITIRILFFMYIE